LTYHFWNFLKSSKIKFHQLFQSTSFILWDLIPLVNILVYILTMYEHVTIYILGITNCSFGLDILNTRLNTPTVLYFEGIGGCLSGLVLIRVSLETVEYCNANSSIVVAGALAGAREGALAGAREGALERAEAGALAGALERAEAGALAGALERAEAGALAGEGMVNPSIELI
jgi:hypothetical protein